MGAIRKIKPEIAADRAKMALAWDKRQKNRKPFKKYEAPNIMRMQNLTLS